MYIVHRPDLKVFKWNAFKNNKSFLLMFGNAIKVVHSNCL